MTAIRSTPEGGERRCSGCGEWLPASEVVTEDGAVSFFASSYYRGKRRMRSHCNACLADENRARWQRATA